MKKLFIIAVLGLFVTSCSSGWSCQKRYVQKNNCEKQLERKVKSNSNQNC